MSNGTGHFGRVRFQDRWMGRAIRMGGGFTLLCVMALMVFLGREVLPLIRKPSWDLKAGGALPEGAFVLGGDPGRTLLLIAHPAGALSTLRLDPAGEERGFAVPFDMPPVMEGEPSRLVSPPRTLSVQRLDHDFAALFLEDGSLLPLVARFAEDHTGTATRVTCDVEFLPVLKLAPGTPRWAMTRDEDGELRAAWTDASHAVWRAVYDPDEEMWGEPESLGFSAAGPLALARDQDYVAAADGAQVSLWSSDGVSPGVTLEADITCLRFLLGDGTLAAGRADGAVDLLFPLRGLSVTPGSEVPAGPDGRPIPLQGAVVPETAALLTGAEEGKWSAEPAGMGLFRVRALAAGTAAVISIDPSARSKALLTLDAGGTVAYHHATAGRTWLTRTVPGAGAAAGLFPKENGLWVEGATFWTGNLEPRHPDITFATLFRPVWYENYGQPEHVWQSTGGSDSFEPKLGLWPLVFGTLKGTLYALLFSLPIAVFGALYLSQLAPPGIRNTLKASVEFMSALPSVVVGMLAGLWLAPVMEKAIVGVAAFVLLLPLTILVINRIWERAPRAVRQRHAHPETRWVPLALAVSAVAAWLFSGALERIAFGGSFKDWLFAHSSMTYDQRNCIVVGIALGFAVVPIVFTVCEDAFTAVPRTLTSAALALGASPWQAAVRVVVPAASPGIFAAIMLGLGRAVGETMIVLMATGNTPVLDWSPFNGMRTLSASIAVEVPEAPVASSLYRVLFLAGVLLFLLTFVVNTLADLVGSRLRRKYGRF